MSNPELFLGMIFIVVVASVLFIAITIAIERLL